MKLISQKGIDAMKTLLPSYIDEKKPMVLRTTDQRLLAEILYTLEKLVKLLSSDSTIKRSGKEKK